MWNLRCRADIASLLLGLWLMPLPALAAQDVPGSRDPLGIPRLPDAWIETYVTDAEPVTREFVVGRVDKTRRQVRVEREVRTRATLESATYQMAPHTRREDVVAHYQRLLGPSEVFTCRGRDCGRSNDWANQIFRQAVLLGPDRNQYYLAADYQGHLVGVYVIERGNKRVYAHLQVLKPDEPVPVARNREMVERLSGQGIVIIDGVRPEPDGELSAQDLSLLGNLGAELATLAELDVYVVCHLYGSRGADELLAAAAGCSEAAAAALRSESGPALLPFAAGPLLPRLEGNVSRIELVLPARLQRD